MIWENRRFNSVATILFENIDVKGINGVAQVAARTGNCGGRPDQSDLVSDINCSRIEVDGFHIV